MAPDAEERDDTILDGVEFNVALLRRQRDWLLEHAIPKQEKDADEVDGLINFLDYLLDKAGGFEK